VPKFAAPNKAARALAAANAASRVARSIATRRTAGAYGRHAGLYVTDVLTDYHVHLREDDDMRLGGEEAFTDANAERYLAAAGDAGIAELGASEHIHRFTQALEIWRHPLWEQNARDDIDAYCEFVRSTPLRLGIEMDFVPGAEDRTATLLDRCGFDYVIGSVHFVGERAVDDAEFDIWATGRSPDEIWRRYFEMIAEAARSGLFDFLAHLDLVKHWGRERPAPERDPRFYYEPAVEAIAEADVAVEVSTAGLRKPVAEIYPAPALAAMLVEAGIPFVVSSDAHNPGLVGHEYDRAVETMRGWGIDQVATFAGRRRKLEPLG
jgi:histidinol-phosphatase (PHP family)